MKRLLLTFAVILAAISASAENYILYTSTDGNAVEMVNIFGGPSIYNIFGANIVSNTYENGQGKILFDGEVTSINDYAFYGCSTLSSVDIPSSVTKIGELIFAYCSSLQSFTGKFASDDNRCLIVDGELSAFAPAELSSYTIPNSVTKIGSFAFSNCKELASVEIPNSVTFIGKSAFNNCERLTSITIPNTVTNIERSAFESCI